MKKMIYAAILTSVFYSCKQSDVDIASKSEVQNNAVSQSQIEQAEKELGYSLFKKEIEYKDAIGQNSVKFRFAGKDEASIDAYLNQYDVIIKPISESEKKEMMAANSNKKTFSNSTVSDNVTKDTFTGIAVDFVSKKLKEGMVGYSLTLIPRKTQSPKNARTEWNYTYECWMNWPEECIIDTNGNPAFISFQERRRWWMGWGTTSEIPGFNERSTFYVDGPWRVRVRTDTNISVSWVDYEADE